MGDHNFTESEVSGAAALGGRLRQARLRHDPPLTLKQLAGDRLSVAMVSRLERGDVMPSLDTLAYLARRLDVPLAWLVDPRGHQQAAAMGTRDAGRALLRLGRPDAALERLDEALRLDPASDAAFDRAEALLALGRTAEADAAVEGLPREDPRTDRAAGLVLLAQGRPHAAVAALRRAAAILQAREGPAGEGTSPGERVAAADVLHALARALEASGSRETAAMTLRQAARHLAGLTTARAYGLAIVARAQDEGPGSRLTAAAALAEAAWAAALDLQVRVALARLELRAGRRRDALAALEPVVGVAPSAAGELDSVLRDLAAADRGQPRHADAASRLAGAAAAHESLGNYAEAEEGLRRAALAERAAGRPIPAAGLLLDAAVIWLRAGDRERALSLLSEVRPLLQAVE